MYFDTPILQTQRQPVFIKKTWKLVHEIKKLPLTELAKFLKVSPALAMENWERYQQFGMQKNKKNSALYAFAGDVYDGLQSNQLSSVERDWADNHICILSGLYGALFPYDIIEPYRLEMNTKLSFLQEGLYQYWRDDVTDLLLTKFKKHEKKIVINLASIEYSDVIDRSKFDTWIDVSFLERQGKQLKTIAFYTKRARGMLARFIIQHAIDDPVHLARFASDGYTIHTTLSKPQEIVFVRDKRAKTIIE